MSVVRRSANKKAAASAVSREEKARRTVQRTHAQESAAAAWRRSAVVFLPLIDEMALLDRRVQWGETLERAAADEAHRCRVFLLEATLSRDVVADPRVAAAAGGASAPCGMLGRAAAALAPACDLQRLSALLGHGLDAQAEVDAYTGPRSG